MKTKVTNEILAKYFSGNCSDQEKQEIEHWKEISEDNSRVFEELKALWRNAFITNTYNPDTEASLQKVNSKLGFFNKEKAHDSKVIGFHVLRFTLRAAAALLIICAGYWFFHQHAETAKHQTVSSVSAIDEKKVVIPPDSSVSEDNPALSYLWDRNKINQLDDSTKFYSGDDKHWQQSSKEKIGIKKEVAVPEPKHNLLTQNNSLIAADSINRNKSHEIVEVEQPLPLPQGVSDLAVAENYTKSRNSTTVEEMLQGRLGGVDISTVSGDPGAGLNIRIRGTASHSSKNNPLIVINGIPYDAQIDANFDFANADVQKFANLIDVSPEDIESIEVLKDAAAISKYGDAAANGVLIIKTKKGNMKSVMSTTVEEMLQGRLRKADISSVSGDPGAGLKIRFGDTSFVNVKNNPLIVLNGIPYDINLENFDFATADVQKFANFIDVSPEEIESIEFLKDNVTTAIWGSRAANGVIYIRTKKGDMRSVKSITVEEIMQQRIRKADISSVSGADLNMRRDTSSDNVKKNPLVVVNGIRYDTYLGNFDFAAADVQKLVNLIDVSPEEIESIEVLNDAATLSKYGDAAANGVLNIKTKTKRNLKSIMSTTVEEMLQGRLRNVDISSGSDDPGAGLNIRRGASSNHVENNPLIVDGIPYAAYLENFDFATADVQKFANLIGVSPEEIVSIDVLKDAATLSKYGTAASNGVISVKTKGGKAGKLKINTDSGSMKDTGAAATNRVIKRYAQNSKTFKIEDLKRPDKLFWQISRDQIFKNLITSVDFPYNIVASSNLPDSLVSFGFNSFFYGMYQAYADHRPFVLSPDMIWLLISQGFSRHVNSNTEDLRKYFVDFSGKVDLIVRNDQINLNDPNSPWELVFPEFTNKISKYTGKELIDVLSSNFTTTTTVEKVASEITIMEAMKPYFDYTVMRISCGIPEITLEGTTKDWQKVLKKAQYLRKYELGWWIDEIEPILKKFVEASEGEVDTAFWRNMFKYRPPGGCGKPEIIDGWIVKFFPYGKKGNRNNLEEIKGKDKLPQEIVKVDLKFVEMMNGQIINTTPLELWAGFFGLEQDKSTFALRPKIGWLIRKKDTANSELNHQLEKEAKDESGIAISVQQIPNKTSGLKEIGGVDIAAVSGDPPGISIRVQEIPDEIFGLKEIRNLAIYFTDSILVPDQLKNIKIGKLSLSGKIDKSEIERISKMFPDTRLTINGEKINPR